MLANACRDFIARLLICRARQFVRINAQKIVAAHSRMNMDVQVRHFLERSFADGMPKADPFVWESFTHGARDARDGRHQGSSGGLVQIADVVEMLSWNYQHVTGMKLAKIDKRHRQFVLKYNARCQSPAHNFAERAISSIQVSSAMESAV